MRVRALYTCFPDLIATDNPNFVPQYKVGDINDIDARTTHLVFGCSRDVEVEDIEFEK
jgi:hypothetical protein